MLFQPMLPEVAAGIIEMRHVVMPLALVCPHAEVIVGRVTRLDLEGRCATVATDGGLTISIGFDHVVVAVGAVVRAFPIPGLIEHAVGCSTALDCLYLRNQVLRLVEAAAVEPDPERRRGLLTFVFVGGGYAGVETLAELRDLAQDALHHYPALNDVPQHWVLVDAAPKILAAIPSKLGQYATDLLSRRGVDLRLDTRIEKVVDGRVALSDGTELDAGLLVWAAGVKANPVVGEWGLPLDERGRVKVGSTLAVDGYEQVWAVGDCAGVPNAATGGEADPPTSQHAMRQAKRLAKNLIAIGAGRPLQPYGFKALGQVATLGRRKGIADLRGVRFSGLPGWFVARGVHLMLVPGFSRKMRVLADWLLSLAFRSDIVTFGGLIDAPPLAGAPTRGLVPAPRLPSPSD
jgi:NADH dehydrogenase